MAEEKTFNVPLRKGFIQYPKHKRAKRAIATLKKFLEKHMKTEQVKLGPMLNKKLWERGIRNPPHHVKVTVFRDEEEVKAELFGHKFPEKKEKKEKKEGLAGKIAEKLTTKEKPEEQPKTEEIVIEEKPETKVETKTPTQIAKQPMPAKREKAKTMLPKTKGSA